MNVIGDRIGRRTHDLLQRERDWSQKYADWLRNARQNDLLALQRITEASDRRITEEGDLRISQGDG